MSTIPVIQIRGSSLLAYNEPLITHGRKSRLRQMNMRLQAKKAYSGAVTQGGRKRLARAITIMTQAVRGRWITNPVCGKMQFHRLSFITLTVSSSKNITAAQGYQLLLSHFLDWLTRTVANVAPSAKTYIWKAELQKRGQLHYHITTPAWIHLQLIRDKWNELQHKAGLLDDYALEHGHFDPNSTDVHDVRHVKQMDRYLIKELNKSVSAVQLEQIAEIRGLMIAGDLTKEEGAELIKQVQDQKIGTVGKVWGCSQDLEGVKYFTLDLSRRHEKLIEDWEKEGKISVKREDFYMIVYCDHVDPPDLLNAGEARSFKEYLKKSLDRTTKEEGIPALCLQDGTVDNEQEYLFEELVLNLN